MIRCFGYLHLTNRSEPMVPAKTNHTVTFFLNQKPSGAPDDD
jgi:hypothetical protein